MAKRLHTLSEKDREKITNYINQEKDCSHENCIVLENVLSLPTVPARDSLGQAYAYPVALFLGAKIVASSVYTM